MSLYEIVSLAFSGASVFISILTLAKVSNINKNVGNTTNSNNHNMNNSNNNSGNFNSNIGNSLKIDKFQNHFSGVQQNNINGNNRYDGR